jgi:hypothetical protein
MSITRNTLGGLLAVALGLLTGCASSTAATFATPEEAVQRLCAAADDETAAEELLGAGGFALLRSGDEVADRADVDAVRAKARERVAFEDVGEDCKLAVLGTDEWELPIPLVREDGRWRFDVEAGREEVVNRRVGRNELSVIDTLRELVDAQREYAETGRDGNPPAYAERFFSTDGKRNGLYWPVAEGEPESPLGPLIAEAAEDGYRQKAEPSPYHGYFYRVLTEQGAAAPGGARSYRDASGRLTLGFAFVAWPASHGDSGVMTFVVNRQGIVFQRDLGPDTAKVVAAMKAYAPDGTWAPVVE